MAAMDRIESRNNPRVREAAALKLKKNRQARREFLAEGDKVIEYLIAREVGPAVAFLSVSYSRDRGTSRMVNALLESAGQSFLLSDEAFERMSAERSPMGIAAVSPFIDVTLEEALDPKRGEKRRRDALYLLDVRDPGNLGTIIRTADAAGFKAVAMSPGCADLYNPKAVRATAGSLYNIELVTGCPPGEFMAAARERHMAVLAADPHSGKSVFDADVQGRMAVVLGAEASGLDSFFGSESGLQVERVRIPMSGEAESLNVAAAAAVICFALRRACGRVEDR